MRRVAWTEIDLGAIAHNVQELRRLVQPKASFMAVVKANAYGHGAVEISQTALANGANWLGVALLDEALVLRKSGITAPILILGYVPEEQAEAIVESNIRQTVFSFPLAQALSQAAQRLGKPARIHLKIDTGMGRIGFRIGEESIREILRIRDLPGLEIEGIFSHFSTADASDKEYAHEQLTRFNRVVKQLEAEGLIIPIHHIANSAAVIDMPESHLDLVRPGISIYGLYPSDEVKKDRVALRPALSLKARITQVKEVSGGTAISYGRTYITSGPTRIASLALGYADGYPRVLSNRGEVLVHGQRAPVVGTITMDQFMVDVGHIPGVQVGDEVVILGRQGNQTITAEEIGEKTGTINYEIVTRIGLRLPKVFLRP
ncbi:MAG: alanine racemase [Syntrophomonadaceae bacterium]|nr:alanine racemase [Syntrophomonadaceae bacterium]